MLRSRVTGLRDDAQIFDTKHTDVTGLSPTKELHIVTDLQSDAPNAGALTFAPDLTATGYTNGVFDGTPSDTSRAQTAIISGLTYTNSQFSGTTSGGILALNGAGTAPGDAEHQ